MAFSAATCRTWVRDFARNAGDSSMYADATIDRALQTCIVRACSMLRYPMQWSAANLTDGDSELDLSGISGFDVQTLIAAYLIGIEQPLTIVDIGSLWRMKYADNTSGETEGIPTHAAFYDPSKALIYPVAGDDYDLQIRWYKRPVLWTPGATCNDVGLPEDWLVRILTTGVPALLQSTEPAHQYASQAWQMFESWLVQMKSATGGAQVVQREQAE